MALPCEFASLHSDGRDGRNGGKIFATINLKIILFLRVKIRTQKEVFFNNGKTDEAGA